MYETINIRGVNIRNVTMNEAMDYTREVLTSERTSPAVIYTPNAEIAQLCIDNPEIAQLINSADFIIPDGAGVVLASKILGKPLKEKVAGVTLSEKAIGQLNEIGGRLYLLGGKPGVAETAKANLAVKYPNCTVCGVRDGYFKPEDEPEIIAQINAAAPDAVFVCLGAPRQEKWIARHRGEISAKLMMGLGGSIDIWAGTAKMVPDIFLKLNLEWFYRLCKQPSRLGRMMKLPKYVFGCMFYRIRHGKGA